MGLSQLDIERLGGRSLPDKVANLDKAVRGLVTGELPSTIPDTVADRPNLAVNSSFEFYDRDADAPVTWTAGAGATLGAASGGYDGTSFVQLAPGGAISQGLGTLPEGALVVTVYARASAPGGLINVALTPTAAAQGDVFLVQPGVAPAPVASVPSSSVWYRFGRQFLITSGAYSVSIVNTGSASVDIDAVKVELEEAATGFILPSSYRPEGAGGAEQVRNFSAVNITTGTLVVGGTGEVPPSIVVKDNVGVEIVEISDAVGGIEVTQESGISVTGSGSIEVSGGGDVVVAGGGSVIVEDGGSVDVTGNGGINVSGGSINVLDGSINVTGTGAVVVGGFLGQRTEVRNYGIVGYSSAGSVVFALNEAGAVGSVDIEDGDVLIGNGGTSYAFWDNSEGKLTIRGSIRVGGDDELIIDENSFTFSTSATLSSILNGIEWKTDGVITQDIRATSGGVGEELYIRTHAKGTGVSRIALYALSNPAYPSRRSALFQLDGNAADNTSVAYISATVFTTSVYRLHIGGYNGAGEGYLTMGETALPKHVIRVTDQYLRLNQNPSGGQDFLSGVYTPGHFRADGRGTFAANTTHIGGHSLYGDASFSSIWREGMTHYALLFNANNTYLNSNGGEILFRDNNGDRGKIDSGGLTINNSIYAVNHVTAANGNVTAGGYGDFGGYLYADSYISGETVTSRGHASVGSSAVNYWPSSGNWQSGGSTLLLNGLDYTSITFHDAGSRVDAIVAGGGFIRIGENLGWGSATTVAQGSFQVNGSSSYFAADVGVRTAVVANHTLRAASSTNTSASYAFAVTNASGTNLFYVRGDNYKWANGAIDTSSDGRLKENIEDLGDELTRLRQVRWRKYRRLGESRLEFGVVAQELRALYPELVTEVTHPRVTDDPEEEPVTELAVNYQGLSIALGRALVQLDRELDQTRKQAQQRLNALEERLAALEAKLA